jgi:alginate O-acetyltransferase complex protein AlgI
MLFTSLEFFAFLAVVYLLHRAAPCHLRNLVLLTASYVFYLAWDWRFLAMILLSTASNYLAGLKIAATAMPRKKHYLRLIVIWDISLLFFFKYFNFFADNFAQLLQGVGLRADWATLEIIIPLGISFYTFQNLAYVIDVYRGATQPARHFPDFALFVAFFPPLIAGPIERGNKLLPQIQGNREISIVRHRKGLWLVLWGLFKKIFIADNLAPLVGSAFASSSDLTGPEVLLTIYACSIQLYADFSGYSDLVRGIAEFFGFDLTINFKLPLLARSPTDFWQRWHLSLSSWLRDYLYKPLGGSAGGMLKTCRNLIITMSLCGLWHEASWNFLLWGLYHGVLLALDRVVFMPLNRRISDGAFSNFTRIAITFQLMAFGRLICRADSLDQLRAMLSRLPHGWSLSGASLAMAMTFFTYAWPLLVMEWVQGRSGSLVPHEKWPLKLRLAMYSLLAYLLFVYGAIHSTEFIYANF